MTTFAEALYRDSQFSDLCELPHAGSALEHPLVFDSTARELKAMAELGMVEVVGEHASLSGGDWLIDSFSFRRRR